MITHPNNDAPWLISSTNLEVCAFRDMIEQEFKEVFRFFDLVPHDALREPLVDIQGLLACYRVLTNQGMLE